MKLLDLTCPTPQENLACDEALLEACEQDASQEVLRFWEPREHFVVLGYSSRISVDVKLPTCKRLAVPVFRRASGGGTVLQGRGCLNYSLILRMDSHSQLGSITGTTAWILDRHRKALESVLKLPVQPAGQSDLAIEGLKFSGNAQRRKRHSVLFHGTFLLGLNLRLMEKVLTVPPRQPAYRRHRSHQEFTVNLNIPPRRVKEALAGAWRAGSSGDTLNIRDVPGSLQAAIRDLVRTRYADPMWIHRFP